MLQGFDILIGGLNRLWENLQLLKESYKYNSLRKINSKTKTNQSDDKRQSCKLKTDLFMMTKFLGREKKKNTGLY